MALKLSKDPELHKAELKAGRDTTMSNASVRMGMPLPKGKQM